MEKSLMKMSQPLRIDYPAGMSSFITRRFRNSQLCYANNKKLERRVLGSLGKYLDKYKANIYAFTIFGSHDHPMIEFAPKTKSSFFKDFGARTAEAVKMYVPDFGTGSVLESRTREQAITNDSESHLDRLMYTVLQPIQAGLCKVYCSVESSFKTNIPIFNNNSSTVGANLHLFFSCSFLDTL